MPGLPMTRPGQMHCPFCGPRDAGEFRFGGDPSIPRPGEGASDAEWAQYLYFRDNPRGTAREYWVHSQGCGQWLIASRDTVTHDIAAVERAEP